MPEENQHDREIRIEGERILVIIECLKVNKYTTAQLALATKIPLTSLQRLLSRQEGLIKRQGIYWVLDESDQEEGYGV